MICAKFGWNWPTGSKEEDFKKLSMYFHYFIINSPWNMMRPFFCINLNPLHQKDTLLYQLWLKLVELFWRRIFLHFVPLGTLYLNKLEFPSPKDVLCQVWLKLVQRFWRRRFFTISLKHFCFYLPLGKKQSPSIEQTWILFTQGCYVLSLVEISPVVLVDKKILCVFAISLLSLRRKCWGPLFK